MKRVPCEYCMGNGVVEDGYDDVYGNHYPFTHTCDWCNGEGTQSEET